MNKLEFITSTGHYRITNQGLFLNQKLIVKGTIQIQHLIVGECGILVHNHNGFNQYLRLDCIKTLLSKQEYYTGHAYDKREVYQVSFYSNNKEKCVEIISALNERHAKQIVKKRFEALSCSIQVKQLPNMVVLAS